VTIDPDEILVMGTIPAPGEADDDDCRQAIGTFREDTRAARIAVASEAQSIYQRKVSWGVRCGSTSVLYTHLSIPAMTRLRIQERTVLDTLVAGGVARSRSDALAWCVRLVGRNLDDWLGELQKALAGVEEVRRRGPDA
jgi:hypothetical protein